MAELNDRDPEEESKEMPVIPSLNRHCKKDKVVKLGDDLKQVCEARDDKRKRKKQGVPTHGKRYR